MRQAWGVSTTARGVQQGGATDIPSTVEPAPADQHTMRMRMLQKDQHSAVQCSAAQRTSTRVRCSIAALTVARRLSSQGSLPKASALQDGVGDGVPQQLGCSRARGNSMAGVPPACGSRQLAALDTPHCTQSVPACAASQPWRAQRHCLPLLLFTHTLPVMTMPLKLGSSSALGSSPLKAK